MVLVAPRREDLGQGHGCFCDKNERILSGEELKRIFAKRLVIIANLDSDGVGARIGSHGRRQKFLAQFLGNGTDQVLYIGRSGVHKGQSGTFATCFHQVGVGMHGIRTLNQQEKQQRHDREKQTELNGCQSSS